MRGSAALRTGVAPGGALAGPWVQNSLWTRARAVPSLDLRFADNKSLVDATTGSNIVTHTRASSGTYVGSDGVIRTAVTNLCLQSEDFSTTWANSESSENVNAIIAPNGALTADALVENTASAAHLLSQTLAFVSGFSYTYSIYVKAGTRSEVRITLGQVAFGAGGSTLTVNLFDGSLISQTNADNYDIISVGNGWYRISLTDTAASSASASISVLPTVGNVGAYSGVSGDEAIYIWGAQLEQSATVG